MSKREFDDALSLSVSLPLNKKTKLDDDDDDDSPNVVVPSSSSASSGGFSVTSVGEQSSSIFSDCFNSETSNEIAKNVVDLEAPQISEAETETSISTTSEPVNEERKAVNEALGDDWREKQSPSKTPTPAEIEDFLSELEEDNGDKQKRFIEKYNFDIVNDKPLQGRFKWDPINKN